MSKFYYEVQINLAPEMYLMLVAHDIPHLDVALNGCMDFHITKDALTDVQPVLDEWFDAAWKGNDFQSHKKLGYIRKFNEEGYVTVLYEIGGVLPLAFKTNKIKLSIDSIKPTYIN